MVFLDVDAAVEPGPQYVSIATGVDALNVLGVMELVEMGCAFYVLDQGTIQTAGDVFPVMGLASRSVTGVLVQDILTATTAMGVGRLHVMNAMVMGNCVASRALEKEKQKKNAQSAMVVGKEQDSCWKVCAIVCLS